jgi:hypothetical protein
MYLDKLLFFFVLTLFIAPLQAKQLLTVESDEGPIEVRVFSATGDVLLLGFPFDEGKSTAEENTAASLAEDGIEVWMPDMLSAFMLPNLRSSRAQIPTSAILAVIDAAMQTGKKVYLIASGADTEVILRGASEWEKSHKAQLSGAVLLFPRLFKEEPVPGVAPEYVDAVGKTALPIMMLEGERTPNRWGIRSLSHELGMGGSPVYAKVIPMVRGYFFKRQDANRPENVVTSQLAGLIKVSLFYLRSHQSND